MNSLTVKWEAERWQTANYRRAGDNRANGIFLLRLSRYFCPAKRDLIPRHPCQVGFTQLAQNPAEWGMPGLVGLVQQ